MTLPDSFAPPTAGAPVVTVPTAPCDACRQVFDLRAADCPRCGFLRTGASPRLGRPAGSKSPRTAMWLSLGWPGAGHFYAGDNEKGAIFSGASAFGFLLSATVIGPVLGVFIWLGLALYTAIDAGRAVDAR